MIRRISFAAAAFVALAAPAMAQDSCVTPHAPTIPDGATASRDEVLAARTEATNFIKISDEYQVCLQAYLDKEVAQAKKDKKPLDPSIEASFKSKGAANQKDKERVGQEINASLKAFNAAHPAP